ncbi:MAG: trypsin-like peptidase domain-containing protein [Oscillospiraceae bacterium]|jgi:serine protease Do|nr:trypsin-like peptidase domain-containing protein [Oscillospiraceae bacterium]
MDEYYNDSNGLEVAPRAQDLHAAPVVQSEPLPAPQNAFAAPSAAPQQNYTQTWGGYPQQGGSAPPPQKPKRKKSALGIFAAFLALLVCAGGVLGVQLYRGGWSPRDILGGSQTTGTGEIKDTAQMTLQPTPGNLAANTPAGELSAEEIYDKLKDSNVAIQIYGNGSSDDAVGEGSGILLMEDSTKTYTYIVTCAHVIEGQSNISVELKSGDSYEATVVAYDSRTDVGLLRIKKTGLTLAPWGDSDAVRVGATVYALGNPGGIKFRDSFTKGMVSAVDRPMGGAYQQVAIQHDTAINPGNSGGMLLNAAGQVIGINSMKIVADEYEAMGFAIPSKVVKAVVDDLVKYQRVPNRPKLGIQYTPATDTQLGYYVVRMRDLPTGSLIIAKIDSDSSFAGSSVQVNDIITHVNGEPLNKSEALPVKIQNSAVGDTLTLTVVRVSRSYDVQQFDVKITLVEDKGTAAESTTEAPGIDFFGQYGGY